MAARDIVPTGSSRRSPDDRLHYPAYGNSRMRSIGFAGRARWKFFIGAGICPPASGRHPARGGSRQRRRFLDAVRHRAGCFVRLSVRARCGSSDRPGCPGRPSGDGRKTGSVRPGESRCPNCSELSPKEFARLPGRLSGRRRGPGKDRFRPGLRIAMRSADAGKRFAAAGLRAVREPGVADKRLSLARMTFCPPEITCSRGSGFDFRTSYGPLSEYVFVSASLPPRRQGNAISGELVHAAEARRDCFPFRLWYNIALLRRCPNIVADGATSVPRLWRIFHEISISKDCFLGN